MASAPDGDDSGDALAAIGIVPNQWNSVVPEDAMGFVSALRPNKDGTGLHLFCSPDGGLQIEVSAPRLDGANSDFGPGDTVYLKLGTELFDTRFYGQKAAGGDPSDYMQGHWDGQARLMQLLHSGLDVAVVVHPVADGSAEQTIFTVPGSAGDPGLAHAYETCGDGPRVVGDTESFPGVFGDGQSSEWILRHRTENFSVPVASTIDPRSGAAFRILCSENGVPSMQLDQVGLADGDSLEVMLQSNGREFRIVGVGTRQFVVFPLNHELVDAMRTSGVVTRISQRHDLGDSVFPTGGIEGAMSFVYAGCQ